ncbi:hypothetical protein VTN00DRAFT_3541 [Thermoascus crustaceus]|uniref:uncharacterized protein n=1 Tax=Thermoascus crustaceus TaxID=5088 RepID=UPI0037423C63
MASQQTPCKPKQKADDPVLEGEGESCPPPKPVGQRSPSEEEEGEIEEQEKDGDEEEALFPPKERCEQPIEDQSQVSVSAPASSSGAEKIDLSRLAGLTVNKQGNVIGPDGVPIARVVQGNPKVVAGKKVDREGQIWNDSGTVIGRVEIIPENERETRPEGPFSGLDGLIVNKDGLVEDNGGNIVGKLVEGDPKKLQGRAVDEDGDIFDKYGNVIGGAERWEPDEEKREINPMSGCKVNREGEVRDADGNLVGKLTEGDLKNLVGKTIDGNGYVEKTGVCRPLENLPEEAPPPEPQISPEELEKQKQEEEDKKIAQKICYILQDTLSKVEPICKQVTDLIERADRTPKEDLDEEKLVQDVKPLIEEASRMLQECNGTIRALDPDGRIAATTKARAASHDATPEEYRLADLLKELTQTVAQTIDNGRRRIVGMPHAKKEINPLWALLSEPLFQIIAAVGLLLSGVLGLVSRLLDGLGIGGLVRGLLGGLGVDKLLEGLGLGTITEALGFKKK